MIDALSPTMPRLPRIVIPGIPHHVTQRGNRRQRTFFCEEDYATYIDLMAQSCRLFDVEVWAYCLMPNHVHLIAVPKETDGLAKAIGRGHEQYTRYINFKKKWRGYLWQGRFGSCPMDETHLIRSAVYIELNPTMGRLVADPKAWKWSSVHCHLKRQESALCQPEALLQRIPDWESFLAEGLKDSAGKLLEKHVRTGRPLGSKAFVEELEKLTGLELVPKKPGRKKSGSC